MKPSVYFLMLVCCTTLLHIDVSGQAAPKNGFKIGLAGASKPHLTLAWEHRFSSKKSLEILFGTQWNLAKNYPVFIGDWSVQYMLAKIDTFATSTQNNEFYFKNTTGWYNESALTKLPDLPQYVQDRTIYGQIGLRSYFGKPARKLRPFVQPAVSLLFDQNFAVTDNDNKVWESKSSAYLDDTQLNKINKTNELYKQIRAIELQSNWLIGIHYDAGLMWQPWKNLTLEARLVTAMNISTQHNAAPQMGIARKFYAGWAAQAGWLF
jgi:hypothetical protein